MVLQANSNPDLTSDADTGIRIACLLPSGSHGAGRATGREGGWVWPMELVIARLGVGGCGVYLLDRHAGDEERFEILELPY